MPDTKFKNLSPYSCGGRAEIWERSPERPFQKFSSFLIIPYCDIIISDEQVGYAP